MPKTLFCGGHSVKRKTRGQYIASLMKGIYTQEEMAAELGISQPALSRKLKSSKFDADDIEVIATKLELTNDQIVELIMRRKK